MDRIRHTLLILSHLLTVFAEPVARFQVAPRVEPPRFTVKRAEPTTDLPEVLFLTMPGCVPCQPVSDDIKADKFKLFRLRPVDITTEDAPIEPRTVPAFWWRNADGKAWTYPPPDLPDDKRGYPGAEALAQVWRDTQPGQRKRQPIKRPELTITPAQQAMINKALKAGYSMDQIMQYARSHGLVRSD